MTNWKCEICNEVRPDDKIDVHKYDFSHVNGLPEGTATRNICHCNDRICQAAVVGYGVRELRAMEKKHAKQHP